MNRDYFEPNDVEDNDEDFDTTIISALKRGLYDHKKDNDMTTMMVLVDANVVWVTKKRIMMRTTLRTTMTTMMMSCIAFSKILPTCQRRYWWHQHFGRPKRS